MKKLVPVMLSHNTPSGEVFASSYYTGNDGIATYEPYRAFDDRFDTRWVASTALNGSNESTKTGQIGYDFLSFSPIVYKYSIAPFTDQVYRSPRNWTFEGSADGVQWIVLDTRSNEVFSPYVEKEFDLEAPVKYRMFRLNITANNSGANLQISKFNLIGIAPLEKHLIKNQNKIYILSELNEWEDAELVEPLTRLDFETHGMDGLSTISSEKWNELDDEFEIITWTDEMEESKFIEITTDPFSPMERLNREEEFEVLTWSDAHEITEKTNQGLEQVVDSGKMFKTTIEDFSVITGVEII